MPDLEPRMMAYYDKVNELGYELLQLFELALGLRAEARSSSIFKKDMNSLRLLHYPPQKPDGDGVHLGARAHTDTNAFTILAQDANGGLEIRNRDSEWVAVPPIEGTFVVNVGEVLKVWSDGIFSSTLHRVINRSGRERYSIPFFMYPSYDALIQPLLKNPDPANVAPETFTPRCRATPVRLRRVQGAQHRQDHARKGGCAELRRGLTRYVLAPVLGTAARSAHWPPTAIPRGRCGWSSLSRRAAWPTSWAGWSRKRCSTSSAGTVIVENKPGGDGLIGMGEVVRAAPDGYTLLVGGFGGQIVPPLMKDDFPFDVRRDIVKIAMTAEFANVVVVNKDLPVNSVPELIAYVKARPGAVELRLVGARDVGSAGGRAVHARDRHEDAERALQGRRSGAQRSDRRAPPR